MLDQNLNAWRRVALLLFLPMLACGLAKQTPQPVPTLAQLVFEIQTATPTLAPILVLLGAPTNTPDPNATATPVLTVTLTTTAITPTATLPPTVTPLP